jgi:hypothetical protein
MASFAGSLTGALQAIAPTARATSRDALQRLGGAWFDRKSPMVDLGLSAWLAELEATHRLLLLEGDPPEDPAAAEFSGGSSSSKSKSKSGRLPATASTVTSWTRRCLRAADAVLLVVDR